MLLLMLFTGLIVDLPIRTLKLDESGDRIRGQPQRRSATRCLRVIFFVLTRREVYFCAGHPTWPECNAVVVSLKLRAAHSNSAMMCFALQVNVSSQIVSATMSHSVCLLRCPAVSILKILLSWGISAKGTAVCAVYFAQYVELFLDVLRYGSFSFVTVKEVCL